MIFSAFLDSDIAVELNKKFILNILTLQRKRSS